MIKKLKTELLVIIGIIFGMFIIAAILTIWLPFLGALRIVFGSIFMLFLPGFFVIELAFPRYALSEEKHLDCAFCRL